MSLNSQYDTALAKHFFNIADVNLLSALWERGNVLPFVRFYFLSLLVN